MLETNKQNMPCGLKTPFSPEGLLTVNGFWRRGLCIIFFNGVAIVKLIEKKKGG